MSEITTTRIQRQKINGQYIWIFFAVLVVFTYFFGLTIPLVGPDEPRYAQVAREMFERRDWITPTLGGFDWFEKPALLYWLQIVAYKLFGVSEFSARVGSALFGLGIILSLWVLGKLGVEKPNDQGQRTKDSFANWLALIAATSVGIIVFSRGASFDIILTFPLTAALVGFFVFDRSDADSPPLRITASLFAFYFFIGVSLIAKGLIGIIFPFSIVAFYFVLSLRFPPKKFLMSLIWGIPVILLVAATWYWPMYERNGYKFINEFIIQHHFQRFTSNKYQHPQPFYFFFWVLPLMTIPWLPFFFIAVGYFVKNLFNRRDAETQSNKQTNFLPRFLPVSSSPLLIFAFAWLLVPLVFFSFSGSKLPGYILPSVPAAVILTADYVYKFVGTSVTRKRLMLGLAAATLIVIVLLLQFFVPGFADTDSVRSLIRAADERGYSSERVLSLQTVSHNAEFYAAGRIPRNEDGTQKRFASANEIVQDIRATNETPVLVLVPINYVGELTKNPDLRADVITDNTELAIVQVSVR